MLCFFFGICNKFLELEAIKLNDFCLLIERKCEGASQLFYIFLNSEEKSFIKYFYYLFIIIERYQLQLASEKEVEFAGWIIFLK